MSTASGTRIETLKQAAGDSSSPDELLRALQETLQSEKDFHRLFDARLIAIRHRLKIPLAPPTSLENVPAEHEQEFREEYVKAARDVGTLFLENNQLADAWAYFRTIGEPEPVREAIDRISVPREPDQAFDEVMNLALYEGAHIVRGLEFLLKTHGTCNTVTAFSQLQQQMSNQERRAAAAMMVRTIYSDLQATVRRDVESRMPVLTPDASLKDLIAGREWLFAEGNYHIDVSHLHSTVGFARALERDDPELPLAIELCEYGLQLAAQLQYPADVPFDEYYTANKHFLSATAGVQVDEAIDYFRKRLQDEPDEPDQQLIAFVLLDLAERVGRSADVMDVLLPFVSRMEDPNGFSFTQMCVQKGMSEQLQQAALLNDDVLAWSIAQLSDAP
jgi:hypothetical protein